MVLPSALCFLLVGQRLRGEPARRIKSFLFAWHRDAVEHQRRYWCAIRHRGLRHYVDREYFARRRANLFVDSDSVYESDDSENDQREAVGYNLARNVTRRESRIIGRFAYLFIIKCVTCRCVLNICTDELRRDAYIKNRVSWYGARPCGWMRVVQQNAGSSTCVDCYRRALTE